METYLMFILVLGLIGLTLWKDSPVLALLAGMSSLFFGFEMIGTVWIALVFWGIGIYFMIAGIFWGD